MTRRRMRKGFRPTWLTVAAASVLVLASGQAGAAADGTAASSACHIEQDGKLAATATFDQDGVPSYRQWLATETAGDALEALAAELQQETGVTPGSPDGLSKGLIGIAVDNTTQTVFVVVDPTVFPVTGLQARLQGIVDRSFPSTEEAFPVRIASSCNPAGDLLGAQDVLEATMHASGDTAPASGLIGFSLDPYTSTWRVIIDSDSPKAGDTATSLALKLGPLVSISRERPIGITSRLNDGEPHYGASGIRPGSENSNICTSGPVIINSNGVKGSVTAGHCFYWTGNGNLNGRSVYSGSEYYGESAGGSDYPSYDMVRINPMGESYSPYIHVDPPTGDTRVQIGAGNPAQGFSNLCISGLTSAAVCGGVVGDVDFTEFVCDVAIGNTCYAGGYRVHLFEITYSGPASGGFCQGGDSGGPLYVRDDATDGARIRGILIAANASGTRCLAALWTSIRDHLNVTIATG